MVGRGRPGIGPLTEKRQEFARLSRAGVSISEACRRVGVCRKTGMRWRHGRIVTAADGRARHYPSVVAGPVQEVSPRFLSEDERARIGDLRSQGAGVREIAWELGRNPSTISRELRRNAEESTGQYRPFTAHRRAVGRRPRPGRGKLLADTELREFVEARLKKKWSPKQIAHRVPGSSGASPGTGDDLPGGLPAGAGWAVPGTTRGAA